MNDKPTRPETTRPDGWRPDWEQVCNAKGETLYFVEPNGTKHLWMKDVPTPETTRPDCIWDRANPERCHAASQRSDGECWWSLCPAKDGVCPLHYEGHDDE